MGSAKADSFLSQRPVLAVAAVMVAASLLVGFHAWIRDFTAFQFLLELVTVLAVVLVTQLHPAWWTGLHVLTRSVLAFLFLAAFGLAFVWASASGIGLVAWSLFFGICGAAAVLVPKGYFLAFYIAALFVVVALYEVGLFRTAL